MNSQTKYDVISPDGFSIEGENGYNNTIEAQFAFSAWALRYVKQGYYSSNNGRIALNELHKHCKIVTIN